MDFSVNSWILFVLIGILISAVLGQSIFFLVRALKRAKAIGIKTETIKSTIISSAVFTIAPAIAVLVGVVALSKTLGIALPWLRLSIIGSLSYETIASSNTIQALGLDKGSTISNAADYVTVLWVMTLSIALGLILVPILTKKIQGGMTKMGLKDKKWSEIFNNAMFLGMISAFLGYVFSDVKSAFSGEYEGLIPVFVMLASAVIMAICGLLATKLKMRWLTDYALPISLISGMGIAIPVTSWLG